MLIRENIRLSLQYGCGSVTGFLQVFRLNVVSSRFNSSLIVLSINDGLTSPKWGVNQEFFYKQLIAPISMYSHYAIAKPMGVLCLIAPLPISI